MKASDHDFKISKPKLVRAESSCVPDTIQTQHDQLNFAYFVLLDRISNVFDRIPEFGNVLAIGFNTAAEHAGNRNGPRLHCPHEPEKTIRASDAIFKTVREIKNREKRPALDQLFGRSVAFLKLGNDCRTSVLVCRNAFVYERTKLRSICTSFGFRVRLSIRTRRSRRRFSG